MDDLDSILQRVIVEEAEALVKFAQTKNQSLRLAVELITSRSGPVVVAGIGKSGHVALKIAATLRSLGKPSVFLHPAEASHGDLGIIQDNGTVIILSNSGETTELSDLLHYCRKHQIPVVSMTSNDQSTLAKFSQICICYGEIEEACINGLAPTTTTTLCLAIGDALAVGVSRVLDIAPEDFRRYHPGGKLGSRLTTARDLMKTGAAIPTIPLSMSTTEALIIMSEKSLGAVVVMADNHAVGIITDGDMRRNIDQLANKTVQDIATMNPHYVSADILAQEAAQVMSKLGITSCLVGSPTGNLEGFLHIHDCIVAGQS